MESFVFYRSFAEAMEDLPPEDFKEVSMALIGYALDGVEPELPKRLRPYFVLMRQNVETSQKRRAAYLSVTSQPLLSILSGGKKYWTFS